MPPCAINCERYSHGGGSVLLAERAGLGPVPYNELENIKNTRLVFGVVGRPPNISLFFLSSLRAQFRHATFSQSLLNINTVFVCRLLKESIAICSGQQRRCSKPQKRALRSSMPLPTETLQL
jgi:hypothetical protein